MSRLKCACLPVAGLLLAWSGAAQTTSTDSQPPPAAPKNFWRTIKYSGLIDVNYSLNFNHPASETNALRNFDVKADQFDFNYGEIAFERAAEPVGFRVDFGLGRTSKMVHGAEQAGEAFRYIQQVYVSLKPPKAKGFQIDVGKFVTSAGAEVIETHSNWNYSRSLLFAWAIPYYHLGVRTSMPVHKNYTAGVQLVNGWNNIYDTNSGKTIGLTGALATSKFTWYHNYYVGPEKVDTNKGQRQLFDTTLLLTPTPKANFYVNFDYLRDKRLTSGSDTWIGVALAARFSPISWFAIAPRVEVFSDRDGLSTGTPQRLKEFTLTGEVKMKQGIIYRLEYRRDWSNMPVFDRGAQILNHKNQSTLLLGIVAFFEKKG